MLVWELPEMPAQIKIRKPDDFHVHLREDDILNDVLPYTARNFARALVMPNLKSPVVTGHQASSYRRDIQALCRSMALSFEPLMTIKLIQETNEKTIMDASEHQVYGVKLYPEGVTTNSENGVRDLDAIDAGVFRAMSDMGMVLCVHAEEPGVFSMDRELAYLSRIARIISKHPKLPVVIEHVTTAETLAFIKEAGSNVAGTITVHHLFITLDDVVGDKLNPHNFCKPIAKRPGDRDALRKAVLHGDRQFFLGTDSAPHIIGAKECASGCAGCFTAPVAIELLATLFEQEGCLDNLEAFTSENGARFYDLHPNKETITLERSEWTVPRMYGPIVPFKAGEKIPWQVVAS